MKRISDRIAQMHPHITQAHPNLIIIRTERKSLCSEKERKEGIDTRTVHALHRIDTRPWGWIDHSSIVEDGGCGR